MRRSLYTRFFLLVLLQAVAIYSYRCGSTASGTTGGGGGGDGSSNSYLLITSHNQGASVNSFEETFTGTCDDSFAFSVTEDTGVTIVSSSCSGTDLTVVAGYKATYGSTENRSFTVDNGTESVARTVSFRLDCPTGYIGVPGNTDLSTTDFCVAKYEMKAAQNDGTDIPDGNNGNSDWSGAELLTVKPESRAGGTPFVRIQRGRTLALDVDSALYECDDLDNNADDYDTFDFTLIHNSQWQTIARNIEANTDNWIDATGIPRGHSDDTKDGACTIGATDAVEANSDDSEGYHCTGNTSAQAWDADSSPGGSEQRRTNTLSNGEVIWDMAGNVWEWVKGDTIDYGNGIDIVPNPSLLTDSGEYSNTTNFPLAGDLTNRNLFGPAGNYDRTEGMGYFWCGAAYLGAVLRGGDWNNNVNSGVFFASLNDGATDSDDVIGFRCVSAPLSP